MRFIICSTMLNPKVEEKLSGASPAAGKYLRNLKNSIETLGYEAIFCSYVAIKGAKNMYEQLGIDDKGLVYKDKTIIKSIYLFQKKILNILKKDDVVIFFNILYYDLGLISKIKKRGNKSVLILADHIDSFKENGGIIRGILAKMIANEYKKFDYGIALSEYAKRFFKKNARLIVMEGGLDLLRYEDYEIPKKTLKTKFMYAGTLSDVTGVDILLDAIQMWDEEDVEIYISGKGVFEEKVRAAAEIDKRIIFLGFISDDDFYNIMKKMDVFINPRNMDMEQNQNNFPSKVLEYLATGRSVISTKFPGWEKFQDVFYFYNNKSEELVEKLAMAKKFSKNDISRVFITSRKMAIDFDWNSQAKKIVKLMSF